MPPRHAYWTILIGDAPTAFRAHDRADLLPTYERLRQKQPDVTMKYFARGRLWASPEEARDEITRQPPTESRGREWRPGGTHRDPRDRFKTKRDKPRSDGPRRDRPPAGGAETRGGWAPKRKPFAKPPSSGTSQPFDRTKPSGAPDRRNERKPFEDRKPLGDRKPYA
jgi:hypothetical protein